MLKLMSLVQSRVLPTTHKAVLTALAEHANAKKDCFPSVLLLASETNLSERQVYYSLRWLEDQGLLSRTPQEHPNGARRSTLYHLFEDAVYLLPKCSENKRRRSPVCRVPLQEVQYPLQEVQGNKEPVIEPVTEQGEYFVLSPPPDGDVIEVNFTKGERMRYEIDEGADVANPFARKEFTPAQLRGPRSTRPIATWTWSDVAKDFAVEAANFYPQLPGRDNTKAVAGNLAAEAKKSGLTPALAVAMTDAFFWDRRAIDTRYALWKQYLSAKPRLLARAQATEMDSRNSRQGRSDFAPYLVEDDDEDYDPFAVQRAWLDKQGIEYDPADFGVAK